MRTDPRTAAALALYLDGVQAGIEAAAERLLRYKRAFLIGEKRSILAEARRIAEDMIDDGDWPEVDAVLADKTGDKIGGGSVIADADGNPLPTPVRIASAANYFALASRVDQLAARVAELEDRHANLGAEAGDEIRALKYRTGELDERVGRLESTGAARETPTGDPQPAERVTGDPQ